MDIPHISICKLNHVIYMEQLPTTAFPLLFLDFLQKNGGLRISSNRISSPVTPVDSCNSKKNEPKKVYATRGRYRRD